LDALRQVVSGGENDYLSKDARYIAFFDGPDRPGDDVIVATRTFLRPAKILARCLRAYVDIIPDSQLLLVDIREVLHFFFRMHANAVVALGHNKDQPKDSMKDLIDFYHLVEEVRTAVLDAIGATRDASEVIGGVQPVADENDDDRDPDFVKRCSSDSLKPSADAARDLRAFTYLQPYVTIALANLLVSHGSSDEAIDVLTQWLQLWRCARGEVTKRTQRPAKCTFGPLAAANNLPEWFGIRAEFELNVLLFQQGGEENITYRDFLLDQSKHFADYAAHPRGYDLRGGSATEAQSSAGISIREEIERCQDRKPPSDAAAPGSNIRAIMLRSLLQNENTLLRSELHFLAGSTWTELENLHERGLVLTRLTLGCINPEGADSKVWEATLANYKITSGLLALAIADRLGSTAASADERNRADEIKNQGKQQLRAGYRQLKVFRETDRKELAQLPWSERVFKVSQWEEACSLAERALHQLNEASP
jgi:hypothetical protein